MRRRPSHSHFGLRSRRAVLKIWRKAGAGILLEGANFGPSDVETSTIVQPFRGPTASSRASDLLSELALRLAACQTRRTGPEALGS